MAIYDQIQFRKPTADPIFRTHFPGVLASNIPTGGADGDSVLANDTGYEAENWGIVGASLTNPATLILVNDLVEGEAVIPMGFTDAGWSDLNGTVQIAVNVNANACDLQGVDASSFATYSGGATLSRTEARVHARLVTPVTGVTLRGDGSGEYPSGPAITADYELRIRGALDDTATIYLVDPPAGGNESLLENGQLRFTGLVPTAVTSENNEADLNFGNRRYTGLVTTVEATEDKFCDLQTGAESRFTGLPLTVVITNESQLQSGAIQFQGLAPLASTTTGNASNLGAGQLQFHGQSITTLVSNDSLLEAGEIRFTGLAPLASVTEGDASNLQAGQVQFQGFAPTAETSGFEEVLLPFGEMRFTGQQPTVDAVFPNSSDLEAGEIRLQGQQLTVQFTSPIPDTHRVEAILEAIANNVSAGFPAGEVVRTRRRPLPIHKGREINVTGGSDEPVTQEDGNFWFIDSLLTVYVDIARREDVYIETDLNTDRLAVHQQIMADRTQGLPYVLDTRYDGADEPDISEEGDEPVGSLRTIWQVHYRIDADDPSA